MSHATALLLLLLLSLLAGCASAPDIDAMSGADQEQVRSYQSRVYDTSDEEMMPRAIIATFQDLGFTIVQAVEELQSRNWARSPAPG